MNKPVYKCKTCGEDFTGGRMLGNHYSEHPDHRPAGQPRNRGPASGTPMPSRRLAAKLTATDHIQAAIDKLAIEINAKRQMLADVERIKADITELENQRTGLQRMLAPAKAG